MLETQEEIDEFLRDFEAGLARGDGGTRIKERRYGAHGKRFVRWEYSQEKRARDAGVPWEYVNFRHVYRAYGGCCGICKEPVTIEEFTVDHIKPISRGGGHVFDNLQPAHLLCNFRKGASYDAA